MHSFPEPSPHEAEPIPTVDERAERIHLAKLALAVCLLFLGAFVLQSALHELFRACFPSLIKQSYYLILMSMLPLYVAGLPLAVLLLRTAKADLPTEQRKLGVLPFLGLLALCFTLMYLGSFLGQAVNLFLERLTGKPPVNDLQNLTVSTPFWANLLFIGILAPIVEELVYRKLLIDRLRRYGDLPAACISGLVFGLIHGNVNQLFYAALTGTVFALIYLYTGRLRYSILLHMIINLVSGVLMTELIRRIDLEALTNGNPQPILENPVPFLALLLYFCLLGVCAVIAPIAAALLSKKLSPKKADPPLTPAQWCRTALLNPGVWALLALTVFLFVS